jgi:hypothetical protein
MPVTFINAKPLPKCKHCGERMDYRVIGKPDYEHAHPYCEGRAMGEKAIREAFEDDEKSAV